MRKPTLIDCFSGAGGFSQGFVDAGFKIIYAFDSDEACVRTYHTNLSPHVHVRDASKVTKASIEKDIGRKLGQIDVVIGGPPCQGFSAQRRGPDSDPRNGLVLEFVRLVLDLNPRFFVMENVGGLLSIRGKAVLGELKEKVTSEGYTIIHPKKLDAYNYGVPQHRKRVFIIGERTDGQFVRFSFPEGSKHDPKARSSVEESIHDLMRKTEKEVSNHTASKMSALNLERIRSINEGEGRESLPEHLQLDCHRNNPTHRHTDVYGRMAWGKPSPTITTKFDNFSRGRFGHPELDRTITLREGARLQSFEDSFVFHGNKGQIASQIGNAVPPLLAKAIAERIKLCLK